MLTFAERKFDCYEPPTIGVDGELKGLDIVNNQMMKKFHLLQ